VREFDAGYSAGRRTNDWIAILTGSRSNRGGSVCLAQGLGIAIIPG
jgi:hypothetical protein